MMWICRICWCSSETTELIFVLPSLSQYIAVSALFLSPDTKIFTPALRPQSAGCTRKIWSVDETISADEYQSSAALVAVHFCQVPTSKEWANLTDVWNTKIPFLPPFCYIHIISNDTEHFRTLELDLALPSLSQYTLQSLEMTIKTAQL